MDRLVDEAESLGGAVHSSALTSNSRTETIPDQQLSILNSITANELTGKSRKKKKKTWLELHKQLFHLHLCSSVFQH